MKKVRNILIVVTLVLFYACEENIESPHPKFSIEIDTLVGNKMVRLEVDHVKVNQKLFFVNQSIGDYFSIWPGDTIFNSSDKYSTNHNFYAESENYLKISKKDTLTVFAGKQGLSLEKNTSELSYSYNLPGTYKVVLVAKNIGNKANTVKESIFEKEIVVLP